MPNPDGTRSAELFERAKRVLPGGVSRNTLLRGGHPLYASQAQGCRIVDVDGVERLDFANNMASHIHGHAYAPIVEAVTAQLQRGSAYTMATEAEVLFAEHLCARSPGFDKIRFVNSGTEAVMAGMKAARAFTGRSKIAKVEGSYHGAYDFAEVSQAPKPENWGEADNPNPVPLAQGTPTGVLEDMIIIPFNEPEKAVAILDRHKNDIACIIIDPIPHRIGMVPVEAGFVSALHSWTRASDALLMFDEVITFRSEVGGMQARFDVQPDLTSMGKMIGGGFPVGALAGRADIMDVFVNGPKGLRLPHSGTFSANPVTMTAGLVAMERFDQAAVTKLNALGDYARENLTQTIRLADVPASVTGTGSLLRVHLKPEAPKNYRQGHPTPNQLKALSTLINTLYDEGIMMIHTGAAALSTGMGEDEIDQLCDAMHKAFLSIRDLHHF
ncbi:MAG: aspartate aminotransferase family protein [Rhodobacteraceae bacterium]|nr:aspartate aminotransferase family protein [Paracoccaceae bacterium]